MKNEKTIKLALYDVIRSPVLTEKSNQLTESNQYFFNVDMKATKSDIKQAIEAIFKVEVESVNTLIRKGKTRVFRGRRGVQSNVKKAMVRLKADQRIDVTAGI